MRITNKNAESIYKALCAHFKCDRFMVFEPTFEVAGVPSSMPLTRAYIQYAPYSWSDTVKFSWLEDIYFNATPKLSMLQWANIDVYADALSIPYDEMYANFCRMMLKRMKKHGCLVAHDGHSIISEVEYEQFMIDLDLRTHI